MPKRRMHHGTEWLLDIGEASLRPANRLRINLANSASENRFSAAC